MSEGAAYARDVPDNHSLTLNSVSRGSGSLDLPISSWPTSYSRSRYLLKHIRGMRTCKLGRTQAMITGLEALGALRSTFK